MGELLVAADLIRQGYYVLRSVGPHGPFDVVAYRDEEFLRVEVRSAKRRVDGSIKAPMNGTDECDLYALVTPDGGIEYQGSGQMETLWSDFKRPRPLDWVSEGQVQKADTNTSSNTLPPVNDAGSMP